MIEREKACWISRRRSERSPHPYQTPGRELNLLAVVKSNRDHPLWNPVGLVQESSGCRQQDKIFNPVSCLEGSITFQHVSERMNGCGGGKLALPQIEPVEQHGMSRRFPDGSEVRKIWLGGGD